MPIVVYRDNQRKTLNVTSTSSISRPSRRCRARAAAPNGPNEAPPTPTGFGMTLDPITPELARRLDLPANAGGAIVTDVDRNSPAASGGVIPGDVILEVNRQKVANVSQVTRELQKVQNGQVAFLLVWRDGNNVIRHDDETLGRTGDCRTFAAASRATRLCGLGSSRCPRPACSRRIEPFWSWHTPIAWTGYIHFHRRLDLAPPR